MKITASTLFVLFFSGITAAQTSVDAGAYKIEQASSGQALYNREFMICHGQVLEGAEGGTPLATRAFLQSWEGRSLD